MLFEYYRHETFLFTLPSMPEEAKSLARPLNAIIAPSSSIFLPM